MYLNVYKHTSVMCLFLFVYMYNMNVCVYVYINGLVEEKNYRKP